MHDIGATIEQDRNAMASKPHVAVLGAGVVGVTTAYFLAKAGCQVTVIERQPAAGLETSFANGGLITPSMSDPWAAPGLPRLLLKWFGREGSPFLIRPGAVPGLTPWGLKFLGQCNPTAWRRNTQNTLRLCTYSHQILKRLSQETGVEYDANRSGTLHLFRDEYSIQATRRAADVVSELGVRADILDAAGCVDLEPALAPQIAQISGGIHYPDDEAGDAHKFTQGLAGICASNGVDFRYGETIDKIDTANGAVSGIVTDRERIDTDACVVALGNASAGLMRPMGINLPIYPVKGYSVTFPVDGWNGAPVVPFVDDGRKMGIVRIGDRVRVGGTAEFTGHDKTLSPRRVANLENFFFTLFPDYPDRNAGKAWTGLRPTTPDNIPYLGATRISGLFLNTGHGHLGWTMSCGSARLVADLVTGRTPEIDLSGMTLENRQQMGAP